MTKSPKTEMTHIIRYGDRIHAVRPGAIGTIDDKRPSLPQEHSLCWVDDTGRIICYNSEPDWSISVFDLEELISR